MGLIDAVVFDLDGTLLDTLQDLADSANATLEVMGYPTHSKDAYRQFIGGGIRELARRMLPADATSAEKLEKCLGELRRQYATRWDATSRPYPGIAEMLAALTARRMPMAILSNKPHDFTVLSVERLLEGWTFAEVRGASERTPPKPDPKGALEMTTGLGVAPERVLYVGDTSVDMDTAAAAGMVGVGVTWGFRDEAELRAHGARHIVHEPTELLHLL